MKLLKLTTLTLMTILSLTACDKAGDKATDKKTDAKAETSTEVSSNDNLLADMMIDTLSISLQGIQNADTVTDEQKACVSKIDIGSQRAVIEKSIEKAFDKEEIEKLNEFYSKPEVQKVTNFGREQMLASMGLPVDKNTEQPKEEDIKVVAEFAQSDIGQKFTQFSLSEKEGSANEEIIGFMTKELEKCGLSDK